MPDSKKTIWQCIADLLSSKRMDDDDFDDDDEDFDDEDEDLNDEEWDDADDLDDEDDEEEELEEFFADSEEGEEDYDEDDDEDYSDYDDDDLNDDGTYWSCADGRFYNSLQEEFDYVERQITAYKIRLQELRQQLGTHPAMITPQHEKQRNIIRAD